MQEQSGVHCGRDNLCVVPALRISEVVGHDRGLLTAEIGGLDRPRPRLALLAFRFFVQDFEG
jgi:hypothetical protein